MAFGKMSEVAMIEERNRRAEREEAMEKAERAVYGNVCRSCNRAIENGRTVADRDSEDWPRCSECAPAPAQTLKIRVFLCSTYSRLRHGPDTPVRIVEIPILHAPTIEHAMNAVFHHGQNEIQPQECPSVSCGDVIEITTDEGPRFYRVRSVGFEELVGAERADEIRGCAAADLGSFGKLLDEPEEGPAIDPMTGDYWAHRVRHANARHFGE